MNQHNQRGFALLIAVIFMSVMLAVGLGLGSMSYKQQVLASAATASQFAFYTADAALECALLADQHDGLFVYPTGPVGGPPQMSCDGGTPVASSVALTPSVFTVTNRLSFDSGRRCADVTVYKPALPSGTTYIFSQGYDASCGTVADPGTARVISRGLSASY